MERFFVFNFVVLRVAAKKMHVFAFWHGHSDHILYNIWNIFV